MPSLAHKRCFKCRNRDFCGVIFHKSVKYELVKDKNGKNKIHNILGVNQIVLKL